MDATVRHASATPSDRRAVRLLDRYRGSRMEGARQSATLLHALPVQMRHQANSHGADSAAQRSGEPELRLLEAHPDGDDRQRNSLEGFARAQQASSLSALEKDYPALLRPEGAQLPLVWRCQSAGQGLGRMATRRRGVYRLCRARAGVPAIAATFHRPLPSRCRLCAGQDPLERPGRASTKPSTTFVDGC